MIRSKCEVLSIRQVGAYWSLTLVAPEIAEQARPGQFIAIAVPGGRTFLLRRAFSIHQASRRGGWAGTLEVVFQVVGPGTEWLAGVQPHDTLDVIGPLGRGFQYPQGPAACLLVGGGYGAAPLYFLAEELRSRGKQVHMIIGARDHDRVFKPVEGKRLSQSLVITTEDGSTGDRGRVTDQLPAVAERVKPRVIYACGPNPMLRAVAEQAQQLRLPCQVAVEELMACGLGVCWTCAVPVIAKDGRGWWNLRACMEGPVFNAARIWWDRWPATAAEHQPGGGEMVHTPAEGFPSIGDAELTEGAQMMSPIDVSGTSPSLAVDLNGVVLPTPVLAASGCFNSGKEMAPLMDLSHVGGIVTKSVTLRPTKGLPTPRMAETASGMLNAIGLQNSGVDEFMSKDAPFIAAAGVPVFVSVAGTSVDEFIQVTVRVRDIPGVVGIEANISCPNVERRNQVFACHPDQAAEVVGAVTRLTRLPVFAKLTADVTNIVEVAEACLRAGAHGLSLINTLLGMAIDTETFAPKLGAVTGGLSGPAIHPVAVRCVYQVAQAFPDVPIMGIGGVVVPRDAVEMMLAGAWAVQVGTANFFEPEATLEVAEGVREYLSRKDFDSPADLRGKVKVPYRAPEPAHRRG